MAEPAVQYVVTEPPDNTQQPRMYERAVYILGAVALCVVLGVTVLVGLERDSSEALIALVAIGGAAVNGLVQLLTPKKG